MANDSLLLHIRSCIVKCEVTLGVLPITPPLSACNSKPSFRQTCDNPAKLSSHRVSQTYWQWLLARIALSVRFQIRAGRLIEICIVNVVCLRDFLQPVAQMPKGIFFAVVDLVLRLSSAWRSEVCPMNNIQCTGQPFLQSLNNLYGRGQNLPMKKATVHDSSPESRSLA